MGIMEGKIETTIIGYTTMIFRDNGKQNERYESMTGIMEKKIKTTIV